MATKFRVAHARVQANGWIPEELSNIDEGNTEKKENEMVICSRNLMTIDNLPTSSQLSKLMTTNTRFAAIRLATATEHGCRLIPTVSLHRRVLLAPLLQSTASN